MTNTNILMAPNLDHRPWVVIRSAFDESKRTPLLKALAPSLGHESHNEAMAEAQRLAVADPGSLFYVAKLSNGFQSQVIAFPLRDEHQDECPGCHSCNPL